GQPARAAERDRSRDDRVDRRAARDRRDAAVGGRGAPAAAAGARAPAGRQRGHRGVAARRVRARARRLPVGDRGSAGRGGAPRRAPQHPALPAQAPRPATPGHAMSAPIWNAILDIVRAIATQHTRKAMFEVLVTRVREVLPADYVTVGVTD